MKIVTGAEMAEIDRRSIEEAGIPGQLLMENAGRATVDCIRAHFPQARRLLVACGPGNNGGDGFVIARTWQNQGGQATLCLLAERERFTGDAALNLRRAEGIPVVPVDPLPALGDYDLLVDALFGTGLKRALDHPLVAHLNAAPLPRVAVDIPSGVDSATGEVPGQAIRADLTVTFGLPKLGHWLHPGRACTGRLEVREIGFPRAYLEDERLLGHLVDRDLARQWWPRRTATLHKGSAGRVLLIAGSDRYPGAAVLASRAALRMGAGLVYVATPRSAQAIVLAHNPEAIVRVTTGHPERLVPSDVAELEGKYGAICVGPGCGDHPETLEAIAALVERGVDLVDADAIACARPGRQAILTPHHGEMARLLKVEVQDVEADRLGAAREAARRYRCTVLLKGNPTLTVEPEGRFWVNSTGGPALAQGGSGDVLSGAITALLGQKLPAPQAAALGAYLHGRSADEKGMDRGLLAHELADGLVAAGVHLGSVAAELVPRQ